MPNNYVILNDFLSRTFLLSPFNQYQTFRRRCQETLFGNYAEITQRWNKVIRKMLNLNNLEGARGKSCIRFCSSVFHFLIPQDMLPLSSLDCTSPASFFVLLMKFSRRTRGMPREIGLGHWDFDGLRSAAVFEQNWILKKPNPVLDLWPLFHPSLSLQGSTTPRRKRSWGCGFRMWRAKGSATASWRVWRMESCCASEWMDAEKDACGTETSEL